MWHASIAVLRNGYPQPAIAQPEAIRRRLTQLARFLLRDVGEDPSYFSTTDTTFNMRRSLTLSEIAALSPAWLAIPAEDPPDAPGTSYRNDGF